MPIQDKKILRILDANFNRAKEGLRVCEDVCRYIWNAKGFTRQFKMLRHELSAVLSRGKFLELIEARDIHRDVGQATIRTEAQRRNVDEIFWANAQRVKESLRVLEELLKLFNPKSSAQCKNLRYRMYALEQKALKRL